MIDLHILLIPRGQVRHRILHRDRTAVDRDADLPPEFHRLPEQRRLPDYAPDQDLLPRHFRADLFRRQAVVPPVKGMPFLPVPVGRTRVSQAAGVQQPARECVQEFILVRKIRHRAVVSVFGHPAHGHSSEPALADIQPGVRKDVQLQPARGADLNNPGPFCFSFRHSHPADQRKLSRIADISFSFLVQHVYSPVIKFI